MSITTVLETLAQDFKYAIRTMRRAPGVTCIAVSSAALGIGACSAVFAIVNFALFKPLPVEDPTRLMSLFEVDRSSEAGELSYLDFRDLRQARSFEGLAAYNPLLPASIGTPGDPERHWGTLATANYFDVTRPAFALGRGFTANRDDNAGEPPVVVLSHGLWQRGFGADPNIIGRTTTINGRPATIIGVTAAGFRGTDVGSVSEFWIPFSMIEEIEGRSGSVRENRNRHWLAVVGRLRDGVGAHAARAELDVIAASLNASFRRDSTRGFQIARAGQLDPRLRRVATTLFAVASGVTLLVLVTACANVANLLLGRGSARRREIASRLALGASRFRLVRQLLTESLLLGLLGGIGGWLLAIYVCSFAGAVRLPLGWPLDLSISIDYRLLLFCIALSMLTAAGFGLIPALRATRLDLVTDLKADAQGAGGRERFGLRNGLVVAQVAICTVLLICTGLFLRSLQATQRIDLGLKNRNLLLLAFDPSLNHRADPDSRTLMRTVLDKAQSVPGVESVTVTTEVPLTLIMNNSRFVAEENVADPKSPRIHTDIYMVGPRFFDTTGIPILAGQDFGSIAADGQKAVIVNDALAKAAFGDRSPLGRRILGDGRRLLITGVVATVKSRTMAEDPRPSIYLPILTEYSGRQTPRGVTLMARTSGPPADAAGRLREAVRQVDPALAVFDVRTMENHIGNALLLPRLTWSVSAVAASVGLALATIGLYGVISFSVIRRRKELGVRLAIGAEPRAILLMVLGQGMMLTLIGIVVGVFAALATARFAESLLYGVTSADPLTYVAVPLFLLSVAVVAALVPARSAARLDPIEVLRRE